MTIEEWEYETLRVANKCPNCLIGEVREGQNNGISCDYRCHYCGQGYNLTLFKKITNIGIDKNYIDVKYQREKKLKNLENEQN